MHRNKAAQMFLNSYYVMACFYQPIARHLMREIPSWQRSYVHIPEANL